MRHIVPAAVLAAITVLALATVLAGGIVFGAGAPASHAPSGARALDAGPAAVSGVIQGDVDCDGDVDSVDALKGLRHVAGLISGQNDPCPDIGTLIPAGLSGYQIVEATSENNSSSVKALQVDCPPGKVVLGGGATLFGTFTGPVLATSSPYHEGWSATAYEVVPTSDFWYIEVTAICADAP